MPVLTLDTVWREYWHDKKHGVRECDFGVENWWAEGDFYDDWYQPPLGLFRICEKRGHWDGLNWRRLGLSSKRSRWRKTRWVINCASRGYEFIIRWINVSLGLEFDTPFLISADFAADHGLPLTEELLRFAAAGYPTKWGAAETSPSHP